MSIVELLVNLWFTQKGMCLVLPFASKNRRGYEIQRGESWKRKTQQRTNFSADMGTVKLLGIIESCAIQLHLMLAKWETHEKVFSGGRSALLHLVSFCNEPQVQQRRNESPPTVMLLLCYRYTRKSHLPPWLHNLAVKRELSFLNWILVKEDWFVLFFLEWNTPWSLFPWWAILWQCKLFLLAFSDMSKGIWVLLQSNKVLSEFPKSHNPGLAGRNWPFLMCARVAKRQTSDSVQLKREKLHSKQEKAKENPSHFIYLMQHLSLELSNRNKTLVWTWCTVQMLQKKRGTTFREWVCEGPKDATTRFYNNIYATHSS